MKSFFLSSVSFAVFILIGLLLWYLLRYTNEPFLTQYIPAIVLAVFIITGGFIFSSLQRSVHTRKKILAYDKEIRQRDEIYKLVSSGLNNGYWDWDLKKEKIFFSDEWKQLLSFSGVSTTYGARYNVPARADGGGTSGPEDTPDWLESRICPEDRAFVTEQLDRHFSGQSPYYEAEYRIRSGTGEYIWILDRGRATRDEAGKLVHMAGVTTKTQNLKNVEAVLKNKTKELEEAQIRIQTEKARTETVLQSIGEGVIAVDEMGLIIIVNPPSGELLGLSKEQMLGKHFSSVVLKQEDKKEKELAQEQWLVNQTLKTGEEYSGTFYYYRNDGAKFPVSVTSAPIFLGGVLSGAIVVFRDITREAEIDKQKTEFVSLASHQLRTPLSAIRWYTEMVLAQKIGPLNEKQEKYVQEVYDSNIRMIDLVNALLNVSRIEMGTFAVEPQEVDMVEVFGSVVDELRPYMEEKNLHFSKDYENAPRKFFVDANLIRIVFQNLLSNSVKYTPEGGHISITVRENAGFLHVEVADDGYGIPKEEQPKMFSKLFRAENVTTKETEGTGLGLYIIKSVVEKTGGRIWFESPGDNKGTTFFVELPMAGMKRIEGTKGLEP